MEDFSAQKSIPFLAVSLIFYDNKEFMKWLGTAECRIWHKMNRHIVRGEMTAGINKKIYNDYYKMGILAMYKEQKDIADFLNIKSKSQVSMIISDMSKKGIVIPHRDIWNNRSITIYELGTHDMGPNKHETLHLHTYYAKLEADNALSNDFNV